MTSFFQTVHIVPFDTAKNEAMKFLNFSNIFDKIQLYGKTERINFTKTDLGLLEDADKFLELVKSSGIQVFVSSTSGFFRFKTLPYKIRINLRTFLEQEEKRAQILENIQFWKNSGVGVDLNFPIKHGDSEEILEEMMQLAHSLELRLVFFPNTFKHEGDQMKAKILGNHIETVGKLCTENKTPQFFATPTAVTPCMSEYIENNKAKFRFSCEKCALFVPTFFPDGRHVSFCMHLPDALDVRDYLTFPRLESDLLDLYKNKRKNFQPFSECRACKYFKKECLGGCFAAMQ